MNCFNNIKYKIYQKQVKMQNIVTSRSKMTSSQNSVSTRSFRNLLIGISSQRSEKACQVSKIGEGGGRKLMIFVSTYNVWKKSDIVKE